MNDEQVQQFSDSLSLIPASNLKLLYARIARLRKELPRHEFLDERIGQWETQEADNLVKKNVEKLMKTFQSHLPYLQFLKEQPRASKFL
jgi:hypothetical protein